MLTFLVNLKVFTVAVFADFSQAFTEQLKSHSLTISWAGVKQIICPF